METTHAISDATEDDIPALIALYRDLNPDDTPCPPDTARAMLARLKAMSGSAVLLRREGAESLASCTLAVIPNLTRGGRPYALIENVVTRADRRGEGHGKAVLDAAVRRAWASDCYKVMLMTSSTRPETHAFYRAAGFRQDKTGYQIRQIPAADR